MKIKNITRIIAREANLEITGATLLTVEEAEKLPMRLLFSSFTWWLRTPVISKRNGWLTRNSYVAAVHNDGFISYENGDFVSANYYRVCPALKISNLEKSGLKIGDTFEFGRREFEIISDDLALCLIGIADYAFRDDWRADDANDYEKSDVKKYIDEWFEKSIEESKEVVVF